MGLINKYFFKRFQSHRNFKCLNSNMAEGLKTILEHLDNPWCIIKTLEETSISGTLSIDIVQQIGNTIVTLNLPFIRQQQHDLYVYLCNFPNLKSLQLFLMQSDIEWKSGITKNTSPFPQLEKLKLNALHNHIPIVQQLLGQIKPTLNELSLLITDGTRNPTEISAFNTFISQYTAPNLKQLLIHSANHINFDKMIENHYGSLEQLVLPYERLNSMIQIGLHMPKLKSCLYQANSAQDIKDLSKYLNERPQIRSLTLSVYNTIEETSDDYKALHQFKYIEEINISNCSKQTLDYLLQMNTHTFKKVKINFSIPTLDALIPFLKSNRNLVSLQFDVIIDSISMELSEELSLVIASLPSLSSLTLYVCCDSNPKTKLFEHLHESQSLEHICINSSNISKLINISNLKPKLPFINYKTFLRIDCYIRNGINYSEPIPTTSTSTLGTVYNYFKKLFIK
ncbi:hypothetical protein DLAC_00858 [Tieghemostelium lacteum]|uniref:Uncharacterized protein n=1 Tax=Tieghemostelium lacteum TaxID=361077 RepID=A0A152A744_TIELA|nr:hypothetical protein DLAC_00858 [Tieghemostelium lacteum]|eukprot:KYR02058.1 hypothetical protein DLAC_00858 [Tieghemostelium lacteum]